jgi:hypothetical protein
MGDISTLLARAAATPTRGPNIEGALRHARRRRTAVRLGAMALLGAAIALPAYFTLRPKPTHKVHVGGTNTVTTAPPASPFEYRNPTHHYSIEIPAGWFRSDQPLEPWLESPHEILSIATASVVPSPLPGNQAACPSEIAKVAVDAIGRDGAYLGIYEWIRGQGQYGTEPRPDHAALLHWVRECPLPNGITAFGATFTDKNRDFTVHLVLGADAQARRAQIYEALDSFHPDAQPTATTTPTTSHP